MFFSLSRAIALILFFNLLFYSCETPDNEKKPSSGGLIDEVMVIVDDEHLKQPLSDTIIYYLMPYFKALPQPEPQISLKIRSYTQFENSGTLLKKYRNLLFIGNFESKSEVAQLIKQSIGPEIYERAYNDSSCFMALGKNIYAQPQQVIYLFAPTEVELIKRLATNSARILNQISAFEQQKIAAGLYVKGANKVLQEKIKSKFNLDLKIPFDYSLIDEQVDFIWQGKIIQFRDKKENILKEVQLNIMIQSFSLDSVNYLELKVPASDTLDIISYPFALRDTMAWYHVKGNEAYVAMETDLRWPVYQQNIEVNNLDIIESRGLWRMTNPFRGGPYINYGITDKQNNRLIIIDAFLYAAGSDKRKYIRELETILNTLSWNTSSSEILK